MKLLKDIVKKLSQGINYKCEIEKELWLRIQGLNWNICSYKQKIGVLS